MAYEIIMPVLGMSQDTGIIASWCKSLGDYVEAGDTIMEVETDKAIQEIEAAESGYLSSVFYPQNAKVPVGEVVGLLTAEKSAEVNDNAPQPSAPEPVSLAEAPKPDIAPSSENTIITESVEVDRSVTLASGKARAAAYQHQLSLAKISAVLGKNPLHAADIATYLMLPVADTAVSAPTTPSGTQMAFRVSQAGLKHCESWLSKQPGISSELTSSHLIATLVSGLWREMVAEDNAAPLIINIECATREGFSHTQLQDADLQRFSKLTPDTKDSTRSANLQLIDLRYSILCEYQPGTITQPLLVIAQGKKQLKVSLYGIASAHNIAALRFMDTLARQLEEPLIYIT